MDKPYVFITRQIAPAAIERLKVNFTVKVWESEDIPVPRDILQEEAKKADALLTMLSDRVDGEMINQAEHLSVIANLAVGYDNIDIAAADEKGIAVCHTPDVLTDTTADLTFGLLLASARRITEAFKMVKEGNWKSWSPFLLAGTDIHHKTIGLVGMGKIGEAVARRASGFDMKILYHNRKRKPASEYELGAVYCSFDELISSSDFVVCLAPLTNETQGMFNAEAFKKMKNTAIFINVSRGATTNEEDLYNALVQGEIAGAGLDVFQKEPIQKTHPLLSLPNVVALPHIGSASRETRTKMMNLCCGNIERVLRGERPMTLVNKEWKSQ
jgi:glyoxylate reductase